MAKQASSALEWYLKAILRERRNVIKARLIQEHFDSRPTERQRKAFTAGETYRRRLEEAVRADSACRAALAGDPGADERLAAEYPALEPVILAHLGQRDFNLELCRKLARRQRAGRQAAALNDRILKAIPDRYRDLWPSARNMVRHFVLHVGPTNSGKTHDALEALRRAERGVYLGPLRLLAYEQYEALNRAGVPCSLVTGEERRYVPGAVVQSSTIEMADLTAPYDIAVIDECQMIADRDRGGAWSAAILGLCAYEIHLCASPDAERLLLSIIADCGDEVTVARHERRTPLLCEREPFTFPDDVRRGDALIVFSKRNVHAAAAVLQRRGVQPSIIYGALPYDVRHEQARRFTEGETEVVVSTDAIGMGLNMPIRRVVFLELTKFDGVSSRALYPAEIKQIAGRAGRWGLYDEGFAASFGDPDMLEAALLSPDVPLRKAVIQFPETLLSVDGTLTQLLTRWTQIEPHAGWDKASAERMLRLTQEIEPFSRDKELVYAFVTIPFDEKEAGLLTLWKQMFLLEKSGRHLDVTGVLPVMSRPETYRIRDLDTLEEQYRVCDLCYNYTRRFLAESAELLELIEERKQQLSAAILYVLSTQELLTRHCPACGRAIPWNHPYAVCDRCHARRRWVRYR